MRRGVHGREARRMRAVIVRGWLALLLLLAAPAVAQEPRSIEAGETLRVEASANPAASDQVDFYQFVGVMGSRVTLTLDSPNEALLTLYTPRGEEMLYRSGSGPIDIVAVLPLTRVRTH